MILLGLDALGIANDTLWVLDPELGGHIRDHSHRDVDRISKKGSQKPERADLHRKAYVDNSRISGSQAAPGSRVKRYHLAF